MNLIKGLLVLVALQEKPADIERWIGDLASEEFETRRDAHARLLAVGLEGRDLILATRKHPDAEVRGRIETILRDGLLGALLEGRAGLLLERFWTAHATTIVGHVLTQYPVLRHQMTGSDCRDHPVQAFAPSAEVTLGDDGGHVQWSVDPKEVGQTGYQLHGGRVTTLKLGPQEAAIRLPRSSKTWKVAVCPASAAPLLGASDGSRSLKEILAEGDPERIKGLVETLLVLQIHGLVELRAEKVDKPADSPLRAQLRSMPVVGKAGPSRLLTRLYRCYWGE